MVGEREAELLPVEYFHGVYTLPAPIANIAYQNKQVITTYCSRQPLTRPSRLQTIQSTSAHASASPPCCTAYMGRFC